MLNHLYLVRHGENQANLTKAFSHRRVDYSLTSKGRLQAQQTAIFLRNKNIQAIFTSPLKRALETATIIGKLCNQQPKISEAFREVNVGVLEDQPPRQQVWDQYHEVVQAWAAGQHKLAFPGGENYQQLWVRYRQGLVDACRSFPNQNLLIVGHGGIFALTLPKLCPDVDFNDVLNLENHNASISEIHLAIQGESVHGRMIGWGNVNHLTGAAADLIPGLPTEGELP